MAWIDLLFSPFAGMSLHMMVSFAIILLGVFFYVSERLAMEITSLLIVVAFCLFFSLFPLNSPTGDNLLPMERLLSGFANPALFAVLALLVMGQGLFHSGALEGLIDLITRDAKRSPKTALFITFGLVGILSAFLNNTPVVLMFIPVLTAIVMRGGVTNGSSFMALSFVSVLGGMLTLIGSSTNLLVAGTVKRLGAEPLAFFDQTPLGLICAAAGLVYIVLIMPRLLGRNDTPLSDETQSGLTGRQFIVEVRLRPDDALIGAQSSAGFFPDLAGMTIQMIDGRQGVMLPPFDDYQLHAGDRLFIAATRRELNDLLSQAGHILEPQIKRIRERSIDTEKDEMMLAELVVAPGSRMISRAIYQTGFGHDTNCQIIGVQRRSRMLRHQLSDIRLEAGDVLLVIGNKTDIEGLRTNRDALLMEWSARELPNFKNALKARLIFAAAIAAAALNLVPIVTAALGGALAMMVAGVLNVRQAARGIDLRIYLLVGAALAMSEALIATGGATIVSMQFISLFDGFTTPVILSAFFLLCAFVTNVLSNNATAVLLTPIALDLASRLDAPPTAFIMAVIFAANCSFATPIAYQTNLLVMTPGNYRFTDFVKAGTPLILVIWLTYSIVAPYYFDL